MTQAEQFYSALGFGIVFFLFLVAVFFFVKQLDPSKYLILRIMTAIFGAITAGLFTGAATVNYDQRIPGGHLTISGVAGFGFFILVWVKFPDLVSLGAGKAPDPTDLSLHVPAGWTFQQAVEAIAGAKACTVDYSGLTGQELSAPLQDHEVYAKNLKVAVEQIGKITATSGAVRPYDVSVSDSTVHLKAKASA